jgi:hypothetical protein
VSEALTQHTVPQLIHSVTEHVHQLDTTSVGRRCLLPDHYTTYSRELPLNKIINFKLPTTSTVRCFYKNHTHTHLHAHSDIHVKSPHRIILASRNWLFLDLPCRWRGTITRRKKSDCSRFAATQVARQQILYNSLHRK